MWHLIMYNPNSEARFWLEAWVSPATQSILKDPLKLKVAFYQPIRTCGPLLTFPVSQCYWLNDQSKMNHSLTSKLFQNIFWDQLKTYFFTEEKKKKGKKKNTQQIVWAKFLTTYFKRHGTKPATQSRVNQDEKTCEHKPGRSGNQSVPHSFSLASQIPVTELPVHHRDRSGPRMSETPICLDMLSCDSIGLRNAAPLMDELSVCLSTPKAAQDLVPDRRLWPCQCPSRIGLLTRSLPDFNQATIYWGIT